MRISSRRSSLGGTAARAASPHASALVHRVIFCSALAICDLALTTRLVANVISQTREPSLSLPRPVTRPVRPQELFGPPRSERA
jgi:hypothetical protein